MSDVEEDKGNFVSTDAIIDEKQQKSSSSSKKKKKKNKKKKSGKKDAAIRTAIDSIQKNEEDALWIQLNSCGMDDGDVEKLCAALKNNTHVLSLDVSGNVITDTGIVALCDCLKEGGATDLIELNVKNQQMSLEDEGIEALRGMMDVRRVIKVEWLSNRVADHQPEDIRDDEQQQTPDQYSRIVQDLFQVGNGDEEEEMNENQYMEHAEQLNIEEEVCALWEEISDAMQLYRQKEEVDSVSETGAGVFHFDAVPASIGSKLFSLNEFLGAELSSCQLPLLPDTEEGDLQTSLHASLTHMNLIEECLSTEASHHAKKTTISSKSIGSHRAMAAMLAATALQADCPVIVNAFSKTQILRESVRLALKHPYCSTVQSHVVKMARIATSDQSGSCGLWRQILDDTDMFRQIIDTIHASIDKVPGKDPLAGFSIEMVHILTRACDDTKDEQWRIQLKETLQNVSGGQEATDALRSALNTLLHEQEQYLCGPPPEVPAMPGMDPSMQFSGSQILELLQGLKLTQRHQTNMNL
ncbi:hypothetical protein PSENEW3_00000998 [Picochlorum sp. SENEW3]|nr:hypothetical protein PSENEW3_00000998 [Picochlorum sp. SENEW3]